MNHIIYTLNKSKQIERYNYDLFQESIQIILKNKDNNSINKELLIDSIENMLYVSEEDIHDRYNELNKLKTTLEDYDEIVSEEDDDYMSKQDMHDRIIELEDDIINMHTIIDTLREI